MVPNERLAYKEGQAYLVYQDPLEDVYLSYQHKTDQYWTFAQELTENDAHYIAKTLAPIFVKAKKKKIPY